MINKGILVLGVLVGAGIGVLLAPEKGETTRNKLKKEGKAIKEQLTKDFKEVKDDVSKATKSGKTQFNEDLKGFTSKASHEADKAISFLEKQLAALKERNKKLQQTS